MSQVRVLYRPLFHTYRNIAALESELVDGFEYDVFLSHSSKDKPVVRELAERLKQDELRVWFDEWEIKPGDSIPARIEDGLERSRVLVLCMSANAFGSDWAQLESYTFRFRDPLNKDHRFIPLRLDDADIKGSLVQLLYIDWRTEDSESEYTRLLDACQPNGQPLNKAIQANTKSTTPQTHDLKIDIIPTRNGLQQLAQIRVLNIGKRPILIDSWLIEWTNRSCQTGINCKQGSLPIRLQDHERADFIIDISEYPVEKLKSLGVLDAEQRFWRAEAKAIKRFVHIAKLHRPPIKEIQPTESIKPSEVEIITSFIPRKENQWALLEVKFTNLGPHDLKPVSALLEWEYDPPREMPHEPGEPKIAEAGGSISLHCNRCPTVLKPNENIIFYLSTQDSLDQSIVAILGDDVPDEKLWITVIASRWQWKAHSDKVPGAIREFARATLQRLQDDK